LSKNVNFSIFDKQKEIQVKREELLLR